ncbi:hypothetical protein M8C21_003053, partial [Ambrosia artemisiifolia]
REKQDLEKLKNLAAGVLSRLEGAIKDATSLLDYYHSNSKMKMVKPSCRKGIRVPQFCKAATVPHRGRCKCMVSYVRFNTKEVAEIETSVAFGPLTTSP